MKLTTSQAFKRVPYDLLLVPLLVVCCYYIAVFQLEHSLETSNKLVHRQETARLISLDTLEAPPNLQAFHRERKVNFRMSKMSIGDAQAIEQSHSEQRPKYSKETYQDLDHNKIHLVSEAPVSTFSVDVDGGGFANIRRLLNSGELPSREHVRSEEIINYFSYNYSKPISKKVPFSMVTSLTNSPWNKDSQLLRIGISGYAEALHKLPSSNIVFLVDISGSMQQANKLPLLKQSLILLTNNLRSEDRISLVTYAGNT